MPPNNIASGLKMVVRLIIVPEDQRGGSPYDETSCKPEPRDCSTQAQHLPVSVQSNTQEN